MPERFKARTRRSPETPGNRVMLFRDLDECPEGLLSGYVNFGSAPGFDVQLDRFAKIGAGGFDVAALRQVQASGRRTNRLLS